MKPLFPFANLFSSGRRITMRYTNRQQRPLHMERLETRSLLAADMSVAECELRKDVDGDGYIVPMDALQAINELNKSGSQALPDASDQSDHALRLRRLNANGDQHFAPLDALVIINDLNEKGSRPVRLESLGDSALTRLAGSRQDLLKPMFQHLNSMRVERGLPPAQIIDLLHDVAAALDGASAPTVESVKRLLTDLRAADADHQLSSEELTQLTTDVKTIMQEANVPEAEAQAVLDDLNELANSPRLARTAILSIVHRFHEVMDQFKHEHVPQVTRAEVQELVKDLAAVYTAGAYTPEQLTELRNDVAAFSANGTLPSESTTKQFLDDVVALKNHRPTFLEKIKLATDAIAVLKSANITPPQWEDVLRFIRPPMPGNGTIDPALVQIANELSALKLDGILGQLFGPHHHG